MKKYGVIPQYAQAHWRYRKGVSLGKYFGAQEKFPCWEYLIKETIQKHRFIIENGEFHVHVLALFHELRKPR